MIHIHEWRRLTDSQQGPINKLHPGDFGLREITQKKAVCVWDMQKRRVKERCTHAERSKYESATDRERCGSLREDNLLRISQEAALWEFNFNLTEVGRAAGGKEKVHSVGLGGFGSLLRFQVAQWWIWVWFTSVEEKAAVKGTRVGWTVSECLEIIKEKCRV